MQMSPDEKLVVGGRFDSPLGAPWNNLARIHLGGRLPPRVQILGLEGLEEGRPTLRFTTSGPGRFWLQRSPDLQEWIDVVETGEVETNGVVQDPEMRGETQFYRLESIEPSPPDP